MDLYDVIMTGTHNQIDFFARQLVFCTVVSVTISLYIFRQKILNFNAIYLLCFIISFLILIIALNEVICRKWFHSKVPPNQKAVFITGCDRGFGYGFAKTLADEGFQVFAGCLYPFHNQVASLHSHKRIHCLQVDVTKSKEVQLALDYVVRHLQSNELWAVINNAGISKGSDIEITSMEKIEDVLDVNLMGTLRVTKTFLPLLKKSRGRVINIASAAGRLLLPGFLPYSISKNAVIAFSDGLRLEMKRFGVQVISIEPWIYKTKLSDTSGISREIEKEWRLGSEHGSSDRKNQVSLLKEAAANLFKWGASSNLNEVFDVVRDAVTLEHPPYRYCPGKWYLNTAMWLLYFIPKSVVDFVFCNFIFKR